MGSKTRLGSYCTKRANNGVNLVMSRNINTRLARPIDDLTVSLKLPVFEIVAKALQEMTSTMYMCCW